MAQLSELQGAKAAALRVLFFTSDVSIQSGASIAMREIVRRLTLAGVKATVAVPDSEASREIFPSQEFDVEYLSMQRLRRTANPVVHGRFLVSLGPLWSELRRIITEKKIDLLHFNEIMDLPAGIGARRAGIRCVCHVRADGIPALYRVPLLWLLDKTVDAIIVPSQSTANWMKAEIPRLERKIHRIHDIAFDSGEFHPGICGDEFRRQMEIPDGATLVTLVSKLQAAKGHLCFIRAAEIVGRERNDVRMVIVGAAVNGHQQDADAIHALAKERAPVPLLRLAGLRRDLPVVYAGSDIMVHCPIYPDTFPTVVLLGMLMGKAVIGSDIGGIPEQIKNGVTGVLVPPDDPAALAAAILRLVDDPRQRAAIGNAAYREITEQSAVQIRDQQKLILEVYGAVLGKSRKAGSGVDSRTARPGQIS